MNLQFGKNIWLLQRTYTSDREKVVAILYNLYLSLSLSQFTALTFLFILMECMHLNKKMECMHQPKSILLDRNITPKAMACAVKFSTVRVHTQFQLYLSKLAEYAYSNYLYQQNTKMTKVNRYQC